MGVGAADRVIFLPALHIGGLYAIAILSNCEFPIRVLPMESEFSALYATGAKPSFQWAPTAAAVLDNSYNTSVSLSRSNV